MNKLFVVITLLSVWQVVFQANLHCEKCAEKVRENVSFEKGVKDLSISVPEKTVTVTFVAEKTDTVKLKKAIERLGYNAKILEIKQIKK